MSLISVTNLTFSYESSYDNIVPLREGSFAYLG